MYFEIDPRRIGKKTPQKPLFVSKTVVVIQNSEVIISVMFPLVYEKAWNRLFQTDVLTEKLPFTRNSNDKLWVGGHVAT